MNVEQFSAPRTFNFQKRDAVHQSIERPWIPEFFQSKNWSTEMRKITFMFLKLIKKFKIENLQLYKSWNLKGVGTGPEEGGGGSS